MTPEETESRHEQNLQSYLKQVRKRELRDIAFYERIDVKFKKEFPVSFTYLKSLLPSAIALKESIEANKMTDRYSIYKTLCEMIANSKWEEQKEITNDLRVYQYSFLNK